MADITPSKKDVAVQTVIWTWSNLSSANSIGAALGKSYVEFSDRSVQISGTFDGAAVVIEGSHNGNNYHPVTDPQGNDISKTVGAREQITEVDLYVRPRLVNAGVSTAITVTILARKTR